ncbi:Uncharacterised protein [uncultured Clostridium sp.]|nr:Uncharacterised protein [uncultured Clostridium sp.]
MEEYIEKILSERGYLYKTEAKVEGLKNKSSLRIDAVILKDEKSISKDILNDNEISCSIELDGQFHFKETSFGNDLKGQLERDGIKNEFSIERKIPLLRVHYEDGLKYDKLEKIVVDFIENVNSKNIDNVITYSECYPEDMRILASYEEIKEDII